ncbi:hypothetical protein ACFP47_01545 [Nesterenkonia lacusekhoensis]|uniref:Uncharacterized protein n=1 Tax=Nesterenkonia lacusekhoensis TaxID=150832 RepID=A0ABS4T4V0_9MICC|nr:hypothetical protein [Nesterenkonia lacusekhoensis]MBP2319470.1 hypothetical protein [Nesterenkonia lacusekhoensis]
MNDIITLSPAAQSLIRDQISLLEGIYPAPVNHEFVVQRLQEARHNLEHLLTLSSSEAPGLTQEDAEHFRTIQVAPLVAEPIEAERLMAMESTPQHRAATHLLTHSSHYAELVTALVASDDCGWIGFVFPLDDGLHRFEVPQHLSGEARRVGSLVLLLLGVSIRESLGELLPGLDPQSSVAFAEACQILQQ